MIDFSNGKNPTKVNKVSTFQNTKLVICVKKGP